MAAAEAVCIACSVQVWLDMNEVSWQLQQCTSAILNLEDPIITV
jgi:hypothetical protein